MKRSSDCEEDEWTDPGDVGWLTQDGQLFIVGRTSDIADPFSASAREISPVHEVEHLLRLEWDASDAAAILIDDDAADAKPEIWVGAVDCKDARADQFERILRQNGIEGTVRLFPLAAIPRGANGKVQRSQLKSLMLAAAGKSG
jgi:O-succinylbenzoic acid--CoA ligase